MIKNKKTEGIILSSQRYQEGDSLLKILTNKLGLISAIAKGARKPTSKRAGSLQPFNRVLLELYEGKELYTVVQVQNISSYSVLAGSFVKGLVASFACELVQKTLAESQLVSGVFELLDSFLKTLQRVSEKSSPVYLAGFFIGYLKLIGYRPEITSCAFCGSDFFKATSGSFTEDGNFVCGACGSKENYLKELTAVLYASAVLETKAGIQLTFPEALKEKPGKHPLRKSGLLLVFKSLYAFLNKNTEVTLNTFPMLLKFIETEV